jgi:large subunit ribosomal protein L34
VSQASPDGADPEPHSGGRGNIAAIIAVVVLAALGYWAFNAIDHQRKMQNCLDSGRHDCEQRVQ